MLPSRWEQLREMGRLGCATDQGVSRNRLDSTSKRAGVSPPITAREGKEGEGDTVS